jgi:hypothetical protein
MAAKTHVWSNKTGEELVPSGPVVPGDTIKLVDDLDEQERILVEKARLLADKGGSKKLKQKAELWGHIAKTAHHEALTAEMFESNPDLVPALPLEKPSFALVSVIIQGVIAMLVFAFGYAYVTGQGGDHPTLLRRERSNAPQVVSESSESSQPAAREKGRAR